MAHTSFVVTLGKKPFRAFAFGAGSVGHELLAAGCQAAKLDPAATAAAQVCAAINWRAKLSGPKGAGEPVQWAELVARQPAASAAAVANWARNAAAWLTGYASAEEIAEAAEQVALVETAEAGAGGEETDA